MPKVSIYRQLDARQVPPGPFMQPSPRHWNPSLLLYKGRLWMSYRYHLSAEHGSRSATALVPIDRKTFQPTALSQHLNLPARVGDEHFEDARLFLFKGQPHISWTEMTGYRPGVDYTCVLKYARLKLNGNRWLIEEVFHPKYGRNGGGQKEKNWAFFECDGELRAIYQDGPRRRVILISGEDVMGEYESEAAAWPWGDIRGGAAPIPFGEGKMLAIFHSSVPTEDAPHYVRYYGAAYVFEAKPPFRILSVSPAPLMAGSEADGHGVDPRYSAGWKPYVVFPAGCVQEGDDLVVSLGVNDWQCAVGRIPINKLAWVEPDRSDAPNRYFMTPNGSLPVEMVGSDRSRTYMQWEIPAPSRGGFAPPGYFATNDGREAEALADVPRVTEITESAYRAAGGRQMPMRLQVPVFG